MDRGSESTPWVWGWFRLKQSHYGRTKENTRFVYIPSYSMKILQVHTHLFKKGENSIFINGFQKRMKYLVAEFVYTVSVNFIAVLYGSLTLQFKLLLFLEISLYQICWYFVVNYSLQIFLLIFPWCILGQIPNFDAAGPRSPEAVSGIGCLWQSIPASGWWGADQ